VVQKGCNRALNQTNQCSDLTPLLSVLILSPWPGRKKGLYF